ALFNEGHLVGVDELNGVFDGDDVGGSGLVDELNDGGKRCALAAARGTANEDESVVLFAHGDDVFGDAELFGGGYFGPEQAQHHGEVVALVVEVAADASDAI